MNRSFLSEWLKSSAPRATWLVRAIVGLVFVSEGIQKFLLPDELGVGRFTKIGIPAPEIMAPFVATVEIGGGLLLILGLGTRLVAVPLLISMLVAITATKLVAFGKNGFIVPTATAAAEPRRRFGGIANFSAGHGVAQQREGVCTRPSA